MRTSFLLFATFILFLSSCTESVTRGQNPRILAMGDSLMASHSISRRSVSHIIEVALGEQVIDRSVPGARILYGLPISGSMGLKIEKQYTTGNWDWIVLNGGGNDLMFGCGCHACERKLNQLSSRDGRYGEIPNLVARMRLTGAKVIYVGYLRSPGVDSPIEGCKNEGDELESRIQKMAAADDGVYFLSLAKLVPFGDRTYHSGDMVHPSTKASAAIGKRIAQIITH